MADGHSHDSGKSKVHRETGHQQEPAKHKEKLQGSQQRGISYRL